MTIQRLPASLTPLRAALAALLDGLEPVAAQALPLADAVDCIAAEMASAPSHPVCDIAAADGWAVRAHDVVGASSYSPLSPVMRPVWVDTGDAMPEGRDCVLDADAVDNSGPIVEVMAEAAPGQGVRRAGSDVAAGGTIIASGQRVGPRDLLAARSVGLETLTVRRPRLRIINVPGGVATARLIAELARAAGAEVEQHDAAARDAVALAGMLDLGGCDLLIAVGGSGEGRNDASVAALARRGDVCAHGIALAPGRTAAVGRIGAVPVLVVPGAPDHGLAAWLALALPALDRLSGRGAREPLTLPLARKIASSVGLAEIALVREKDGVWLPLATGDLPLHAIARADAWLMLAADSEGFAAGTPVAAYLWRE